jgi:hypothetical protein
MEKNKKNVEVQSDQFVRKVPNKHTKRENMTTATKTPALPKLDNDVWDTRALGASLDHAQNSGEAASKSLDEALGLFRQVRVSLMELGQIQANVASFSAIPQKKGKENGC